MTIVVDMTFTHEGNKTYLDGLVNFEKMHMLAQTMRTIRYCRSRHLGELHYKFIFYILYLYVHRNSRLKKSNKMQQYADIYLLLNYCTCFGRSRPSSGVHKKL